MHDDGTLPDAHHESMPVIMGFLTGFGVANTISVTMEFNVVFEYVPEPVLYQMVERKPAKVDPSQLAKGENLVAKVDTGISPSTLNEMKALANVGRNE